MFQANSSKSKMNQVQDGNNHDVQGSFHVNKKKKNAKLLIVFFLIFMGQEFVYL